MALYGSHRPRPQEKGRVVAKMIFDSFHRWRARHRRSSRASAKSFAVPVFISYVWDECNLASPHRVGVSQGV